MARRPRRPRRSSRPRRRKQSFRRAPVRVRVPARRNPEGPSVILVPVNPLSVSWALSYWTIREEAREYQPVFDTFLAELDHIDPEEFEALRDEGFSEEAVARVVLGARWSEVSGEELSPTVQQLLATEALQALTPWLGRKEEAQAVQPTLPDGRTWTPNFGILQGEGLASLGLDRPPEELVATLERFMLHSDANPFRPRVGQPVGSIQFPRAKIGTVKGATSYFVALRDIHSGDHEGFALAPSMESGGVKSSRAVAAAAGIVIALVENGVWDGEEGRWSPGARLRFALPEGDDTITGVNEIIKMVCEFQTPYPGKDGQTLVVGRSPYSRNLSALLLDADGEEMMRTGPLRFVPSSEAQRWEGQIWGDSSRAAGAATTLYEEEGGLSLEGYGKFGPPGTPVVTCAGTQTEPYLIQPAIISWLAGGISYLKQFSLPSEGLGRMLEEMYLKLPSLVVDFYGSLPPSGGEYAVARFLPAMTENGGPSYYGSPPMLRRVAFDRLAIRGRLVGQHKGYRREPPGRDGRPGKFRPLPTPPPLLALAMQAELATFLPRGHPHERLQGAQKAIQAARDQSTVEYVSDLKKARDKRDYVDDVWKHGAGGKIARPPMAAIPLQDFEGNPICGVVFTIYAVIDDAALEIMGRVSPDLHAAFLFKHQGRIPAVPPYDVFYQSPVLTPAHLDATVEEVFEEDVEQFDPALPEPFSPLLALRRSLAIRSGLVDLATYWGGAEDQTQDLAESDELLPVPFSIVGAITVDGADYDKLPLWLLHQEKAELEPGEAEERGKPKRPNYPQAYPLGRGTCGGRKKREIRLLVTSMRMPKGAGISFVPKVADLKSPYGKAPRGLVPARPGVGVTPTLAEKLVQVLLVRTREGAAIQPGAAIKGHEGKWIRYEGNLFGMKNIKALGGDGGWAATKELLADLERKVAAEQERSAKPITDAEIYYAILGDGVPTVFGGAVTSQVRAGRAGKMAKGGYETRQKRGQPTRPGSRLHTSKPGVFFRDIIQFAKTILTETRAKAKGLRRVEQRRSDELRAMEKASVSGPAEAILDAYVEEFEKYQILVPKPGDKKGLRKALRLLKAKITAVEGEDPYEQKVQTGLLPTQVESEESEDFLDEMARKNSRRPRRPRRKRKGRRNPQPGTPLLTEDEVERSAKYAVEYEKDPRGITQDLRDFLEGTYAEVRSASPPMGWPITAERVQSLFPTTPGAKWTPSARLQYLQQFPLIARVTGAGLDKSTVERGRAADFRGAPWQDPEVLQLVMARAELTLDQAADIIRQQRLTRGVRGTKHRSMQASSALCKKARLRRLKNYKLPKEVFDKTGPSSVILWLSPATAYTPRVMTYKNGAHIDCDMVGKQPADAPGLVGKALQAALYWLVEKPGRAKRTTVYFGQVGGGTIRVLRDRDEAISLEGAYGRMMGTDVINLYARKGASTRMTTDKRNYFKAAPEEETEEWGPMKETEGRAPQGATIAKRALFGVSGGE